MDTVKHETKREIVTDIEQMPCAHVLIKTLNLTFGRGTRIKCCGGCVAVLQSGNQQSLLMMCI